MVRFSHTLIVLFSAALLASPASANTLLNPGFEAGTGADAMDWAEISGPSGSTSRSNIMPHTGSFHAYLEFDHINNPAAGAAYFIEQIQPVGSINSAVNYNLSFFAKTDSLDFIGVDMFYQILWLDQDASDGGGVQGEVLTPLIPAGINTTYQQFSLNDLDVPNGADSFLLRFQLSAGAVANIANGLYIDDASLTAVPEPASLSLLAIGGLLTCIRRRRGLGSSGRVV